MKPLNREDVLRQYSVGVTLAELARQYECSISTIQRCIHEDWQETNRRCRLRHHRQGPIDTRITCRCKICGQEFETTTEAHGKETCSWECLKLYRKNKALYTPIPRELLIDHVQVHGLTEEAAARIGMTLTELKRAIE